MRLMPARYELVWPQKLSVSSRDCLQIIIVHSSLTKDMNQNTDTHLYRANALRVLRKIIDVSSPSASVGCLG